jgi:hypothetical protein
MYWKKPAYRSSIMANVEIRAGKNKRSPRLKIEEDKPWKT